MFNVVLIANRGEIAVRIIRTLRGLGIRSAAVFTAADTDARHVREADLALPVGSYLSVEDVVAAAREAGADAVHPGYGFLAENAGLARACAESGLVFVGPSPEVIATMGDKICAKQTVAAAGVPVVPGRDESGLSDEALAEAALEIGLNAGAAVLLKPSAGGGGKGMRLVRDGAELPEAIAAARREARGAFGDDTLLVERYIDNPRHIEIQIFADTYGQVVHLGERECSLQRRHQKIIEEAPSPLLGAGRTGEETRAAMGASAVAAARAVGYVGAGTVEYIVSADRPEEFFFMEMNTRLQVEHPVTEWAVAVSGRPGLDLVELQLRVAAGERLPFGQQDVGFAGHAVEARVYAEDPARGFLPTGGRVLLLDEPSGPDVRVDSGLSEGGEVGGAYDPMLAKVIARGPDRATALARLDRALGAYTLLGVGTNVAFLRSLLTDPDVVAGRLDTGLVERRPVEPDTAVPDDVLAAAALERMLALEVADPDPWAITDGWRLGGPAWTTWRVAEREVRIRGRAAGAEVSIDGGDPLPARVRGDGRHVQVTYAGRRVRFGWARDGDLCWLGRDGRTWALEEREPLARRADGPAAMAGAVRSPMPGTVQVVKVAEGQDVVAGQPLVVVEAMKMEHTVTAPVDGVVSELTVRPGAQVALDETLAVIIAKGEGVMRVPLDGLPARVTIYEVGARDGLQNEDTVVPVEVKAEFVSRLAGAGLQAIEATSFAHPRWVPQLADAEELLAVMPRTAGVRYPVLVPNERGLDRALAAGVTEIAIFGSATETFARRNLNRTVTESIAMFAPVVERARAEGVGVRGYVSMCFGDPWEGDVPIEQVVGVAGRLLDLGVGELSLGDTIGVATPGHVTALISALRAAGLGADTLAVHFHDTYGQALANTLAALQCGVTTVDASAGGLGGCPYAESATGNLATEDLVWMLDGLGIETGVDLQKLAATSRWMAERLGRPSPSRVVQALS